MRLLHRERHAPDDVDLRPEADEAPLPQPEKRGRLAILKGAFKEANRRHITNLAAALAYYAFLAIPSSLLVVLGVFGLVASPHTVATLVDKLGTIMPADAMRLIRGSLTQLTHEDRASGTVIGIGGLLALWSVGGAMQNVQWALNAAYGREETRGFVRRRLAAWAMGFFVFVAFVLTFGLLVLGPKLSEWVGNALDAKTAVQIVWWVAEWPLVLAGLLIAFAAVLYFGPDDEQRRWRLLSFGAVVAVVVWLAGSGAFAVYVSSFGSYNKTWGSLSAVVVLLTWFWLSAVALLLGAEINAEAERTEARRSGPQESVESRSSYGQ